MATLRITGGRSLNGKVKAQGSKNATLPILASTLLTDRPIELTNVPKLSDVANLGRILTSLGKSVEQVAPESLSIRREADLASDVPQELVKRMRASFLILGPLLARAGVAEVSLPGGDLIGTRPVDLHLEGLKAMGAEIEVLDKGIVRATASQLNPAEIELRFPSVGATEHLMMTAALIPGTTRIHNPAKEPEISDLSGILISMGAKIKISDSNITIEGREMLEGAVHEIIPDRLHAGTFMIAAALCGEDVNIECIPEHVRPLIDALKRTGVSIEEEPDGLVISSSRTEKLRAIDIATGPYPNFATDHHPMIVPLLAIAKGESTLTENVFEDRFRYVDELNKMGADIVIDGRTAIIRGVKSLHSAAVTSHDIRAGVALVLAALSAEGVTEIDDEADHIARGYSDLGGDLQRLGAEISIS